MLFVVVVQLLSCVQLFASPWTTACWASLPSPSPRVCSNSCSLRWWCHPTISSSVIPFFSSCLQSFQHQGLFSWVASLHQVAKVLELQLQHLLLCCSVARWCLALLQCHGMYCTRPLSMGFPRQEYWSALPFSSPGDLPNPGIESEALALASGFFVLNHLGSPQSYFNLLLVIYLQPHSRCYNILLLPRR